MKSKYFLYGLILLLAAGCSASGKDEQPEPVARVSEAVPTANAVKRADAAAGFISITPHFGSDQPGNIDFWNISYTSSAPLEYDIIMVANINGVDYTVNGGSVIKPSSHYTPFFKGGSSSLTTRVVSFVFSSGMIGPPIYGSVFDGFDIIKLDPQDDTVFLINW